MYDRVTVLVNNDYRSMMVDVPVHRKPVVTENQCKMTERGYRGR